MCNTRTLKTLPGKHPDLSCLCDDACIKNCGFISPVLWQLKTRHGCNHPFIWFQSLRHFGTAVHLWVTNLCLVSRLVSTYCSPPSTHKEVYVTAQLFLYQTIIGFSSMKTQLLLCVCKYLMWYVQYCVGSTYLSCRNMQLQILCHSTGFCYPLTPLLAKGLFCYWSCIVCFLFDWTELNKQMVADFWCIRLVGFVYTACSCPMCVVANNSNSIFQRSTQREISSVKGCFISQVCYLMFWNGFMRFECKAGFWPCLTEQNNINQWSLPSCPSRRAS